MGAIPEASVRFKAGMAWQRTARPNGAKILEYLMMNGVCSVMEEKNVSGWGEDWGRNTETGTDFIPVNYLRLIT